MKKILSLALVLAMVFTMSVTAFAADITDGSGSVDITYTYEAPADSYIVTIPDSMAIGMDATVSATNVAITAGYLLTVSVSSEQYIEGWKLVNSNDPVGYTLKIDGADIGNNGTVLTAKNGDSEVTKTLVTALVGTPKYSGNYTDTLTFSVSVVECAHNFENNTCTICGMLAYTYDEESNTYTVYSPAGLLAWGEAARTVISTGTEDTNDDYYAEYTTAMPNLTLAADITLTGENNWTPLGYVSEDESTYYPYIGTIDGNGHTITGLNINSTGDYIAFVGNLGPNSEVKNLTFKDATIIGGNNVATVAADCGGNVTNCHVTGSSSVSGQNTVAGVIALNFGIISDCTNAAAVTVNVGAESTGSGGVVGSNFDGIVMGCFNSGDITGGSDRSQNCGGVVGGNYGSYTTSSSLIIACGNTGNVASSAGNAGGILGNDAYRLPVYACWTKETTELKSGTEESSKDGVGADSNQTDVLYACYSFADTSAVAEAITAMNTAIEEYNASAAEGRKCTYKWQIGTDGYPTLVEIDQTPTE